MQMLWCLFAIIPTSALYPASILAQILPSEDPFYLVPEAITSFKPGELIRSRRIQNDLEPQNPNITLPLKAVHQYLYRTTDSLGHATAAATTLFIPSNASYPPRLLSYQIAYDSANVDCSPSYTLRAHSSSASTDRAFIAVPLAKGWYVVTPDYEGVTAQYVAGVQSGHPTLDSIRVVLRESARNGLLPASQTIIWGYSGGALASEWAAELQPDYAPEMRHYLLGVALGGLVPNDTNLIITINDTPNVGIGFLGLAGLAKAYPNLTVYVDQHLLPSKKANFLNITRQCTIPALVEAANSDIFSYFDSGRDLLTAPVPLSVLKAGGQMGLHGLPQLPLFVYKSEGDQYSPIPDPDKLVEQFCRQGATIEYLRDSVGNHNTEAITGGALAFKWVEERFTQGEAAGCGSCTRKNVSLTSCDIARVKSLGPDIVAYLVQELASEGIE